MPLKPLNSPTRLTPLSTKQDRPALRRLVRLLRAHTERQLRILEPQLRCPN